MPLDDRQPKRSLADDPKFLASLSDLDRGLSDAGSEPGASVQPFPEAQAPSPPPLAPRPIARVPPAPITPFPGATPITIAAPPPPPAALSAPAASAVGLPEPPPWLPPSAFAAVSAASAALSEAFDSTAAAPAAPAAVPMPAPAGAKPRPLLDLFPPVVPLDSTAPSLPTRESTAPPPIAAVAPPRVAVRPRTRPAAGPPRGVTYETFYGLDEKPFAAPPDLRFLYHSSAYDHGLQDLVSSVTRHDPVAVLTGESGIGKTLLCRALVDQLDRRTLVSFVADTPSSAEDLLKTLLVDFGVISPDDVTAGGLAVASRDALAGALRDFLASLAVLQASALLIVDDAHTLEGSVLQELCGLADMAAAGNRLQIVCVGEPSLTRLLKANDLRAVDERVKVRVELGPLAEDEMTGYVAHRIAVAGRGGRVEFDESALQKVFSMSGGIPGIVNQICDRSLTLGYQSSASRIEADFVVQSAQDVGLSRPEEGTSIRDRALIAVLMIALMLVGAAAAGWVFREPLSRAWAQWRGDGPSTSSTTR